MAIAMAGYRPQPQQRAEEDDLGKALRVMQLFGTGYGIKDAYDKNNASKETQKLQQEEMGFKRDAAVREKATFENAENERARKARGELTMAEVAEMQRSGLAAAIPGAKGAVSYRVNRGDGNIQDMAFVKPRAEVDAELSGLKKTLVQSQIDANNAKKEDKEKGKQIPAGEAVAFGGADAAFKGLENSRAAIAANKDISGPVQGYLSNGAAAFEIGDTGKRAKVFKAQQKANAQLIGKYLEGGKMTDSDIVRYMEMLPNEYDSPKAAEDKAILVQNLIAQKQESEVNSLKSAGYNTGNLVPAQQQQNPNTRNSGASNQKVTPEMAAQAQKIIDERMRIKQQGLAGAVRK